jgi:hypothetical protein
MIGADRSALLNKRFCILILTDDGAARVSDVGKNHGRAKDHIIFTNNPGINRNVILNFNVVSQYDTGRNHHILADIASFSNSASRHDM